MTDEKDNIEQWEEENDGNSEGLLQALVKLCASIGIGIVGVCLAVRVFIISLQDYAEQTILTRSDAILNSLPLPIFILVLATFLIMLTNGYAKSISAKVFFIILLVALLILHLFLSIT